MLQKVHNVFVLILVEITLDLCFEGARNRLMIDLKVNDLYIFFLFFKAWFSIPQVCPKINPENCFSTPQMLE